MRTVELIATYAGQAGASLLQQPEAGSKAPAQLQHIHARKKVVVTSKDDQSATGDWADFDIKENKVTLGGDVVLSQGRNVVRGPKLVIDMVTGLSRMESARPVAAAPSAGAAGHVPAGTPAAADAGKAATGVSADSGPGICGGRMCAVFYPKDAKDAAQRGGAKALPGGVGKEAREVGRKTDGAQQESTSSWSSTTTPTGAAQ